MLDTPLLLPIPPASPPDTAQPRASPRPLQFPKRDADEVRLRQRLLTGLCWPIDRPTSPWASFELRLATHDHATTGTAPTALVLTTANGLWLLEDDALIACATGIHLPSTMDATTLDGLMRLACAHWPGELADALGGTPALMAAGSDIGQDDASPSRLAILSLVDRDGGRQAISLRASPQALLRCALTPGWRPAGPPPTPPVIASIPLPVGLCLDRLTLPAALLAGLRPGDALWLPSNGRSDHSPLCLISGNGPVHLGQVEHVSRQFQGWGSGGGSPSNSLHALSPPTEPRNVDALTVDLDFIVGRVAMTVGELSALAAGHVIPLGASTPARVRIVAHGTELGSGQLVDVEGRLAVEILEWGSAR
ncbi:FliM/FliN family flagellar motor switch protein [Mitsuaria sp. GD03876]|uniref:FliM/FliN family flagellar motor switch protein n=1 Tax=Mitsuaria sp. GD03876 TaxID=2975399 RepID=UPI0024482AAF|nr:FliM/FliN family flagellar motor switch protein [Mitsuaria sp. GD03876]MDH0865339.1 FliM/FliN family flagellar motor switch protein [Mitsuaria sp. GD03876]